MTTSTSSIPSPKTPKPKMNPYTASGPPPSRPTFDSSLFSLDASGSPSLSQPYQPVLPAVRSNNSRSLNGKRPASSSSLHPDHSLLTNSPSTLSAASPITNSGFYNSMKFPHGSGSHHSPNPNYFDHSSGGRHSLDDESPTIMDGFTTTPNFDDVEMPPLADDDVYELDDGLSGTAYSTPATGVCGGRITFPPSPRPTISPSPGIGSGGNEDVQIKVEQFTPTAAAKGLGVHIQHPTPISHASSASSNNPIVNAMPPVIDLTVDKRGEDGAWSGGLDPKMRAALGVGEDAAEIPSLNDLTINQQRESKALEIKDWLRKSSVTGCGKDGKEGKPGGLTVKAPKRGRAKSFSDFRSKGLSAKGVEDGDVIIKLGEGSAGAITGVPIIDDDDIRSGEYDYEDDDSSEGFLSNDGSLDDDDESMNTSEAPPTEEALKRTELDDEEEQMRIDNDPSLLPNRKQFYSARPWTDVIGLMPRGTNMDAMKCQPNTVNEAISRFHEYAQNIETASRVATFGSETSKIRRLSASDVDRIAADGGLLKRLSFRNKEKGQDKDAASPGHSRRPSLMQSLMRTNLKRGHSNASDKRRESNTDVGDEEEKKEGSVGDAASLGRKRGDSVASSISATSFAPLKTRPSWSKPGTLKVDTSVHGAIVSMAGITAGIGQSSGHTASTAKPSSPTPPEKRSTGLSVGSHVMQQIRRARSKSELSTGSRLHKNSKPAFGIVSMLGQYGGPPLVPIKTSPVAADGSQSAPDTTLKPRFTFGEETSKRGLAAVNQSLLTPPDPNRHQGYDDSDDEVMEETLNKPSQTAPGQRQQKLDITPNVEGFTAHIKSKTPELNHKLVERIVYEQGKRFKKLVEHRQKHLAAIKNGGKCGNTKCRGKVGSIGAGGQEENHGHKRNISGGSLEGEAYSSDETTGDHSPTEGKVAATQFPSGVPQPPVSRLPAEFECPICFKVKRFTKPSDWTKHVHEDVHPFTCTFVECTEPKSFKRKADWVRHENERHRHLEWWTCNIPDCTHTCYRKDNFVQHLVREHKMAEPKIKAQKAAAKAAGKSIGKKGKAAKAVAGVDGAPTQEDFDKVWQIVDDCHKLTSKLPTDEKCRFCGVACATWKKLTVHLARHMEHISLPVLDLITDDAVVPPSTRGSGKQVPAKSTNTTPVAPMPKVQHLSTDMDIDSISGGDVSGQRQQTADVQYQDDIQYTGGNTNYSPHHTPPRSSPHIPMDFNMSTPPQGGPQYSTPGSLGFGPEQSIHNMQNVSGLHPMINQSFEYPGNDMYPSPSSMTGPTAPSINSGYSSSPTYSQRPLPNSPASQRMVPVMPGQQHLQVQQHQPQQSYFAYGHTSGQLPASSGLRVSQMHNQTVATANSLIENHGQYGYFPGAEIPMALVGVALAPMDNNDDYNYIH